MTGLRVLASRIASQFGTRRRERDLNDEIEAHLDLLTDENVKAGMSEPDARAAARREFGGVDQIKEQYRDQRGWPFIETTMRDLRYAARTFRRQPGFVIAVVMSLSLGIGLNSAIFTVLNALMLRSLPVPKPQELFLALPRVQEAPRPMAFFPMAQAITAAQTLDVRAIGDLRSIVADVRRTVVDVDNALPLGSVTLLSDQVAGGLRQERLIAALTSLFGILALGLASVGLFGVMSYTVSRRTTEFGIRMALGADRRRVLQSVVVEALTVVGWGVAAGLPAVLLASRLISSLLFGVGPADPTALSISVALLVSVAALASFVPAWRASCVDPMIALRCE